MALPAALDAQAGVPVYVRLKDAIRGAVAAGRAIELADATYRGDAYRFTSELIAPPAE